MSGLVWLYIIVGLFALLGAWTFVRWLANGCRVVVSTANDLVSTLKDATEIARAYREDLSILRQIAQSGSQVPGGDEPESIIPKQPPIPATMPAPYWDRFPVKPHEEDAPLESVRDVDQTPTEGDLIEQETNERALDFEAQERQKAATRQADQIRVKELADLGINAKPEGQ